MVLTSGCALMMACATGPRRAPRDTACGVVDRAEQRHRARRDAQRLASGRPSRMRTAGRAEPPVQRLQLDHRILQRGDEEQRVFLVL